MIKYQPRFFATSILLCFMNMGYCQNNPGFIGKKIAVEYNMQYCIINSLQFLPGKDEYKVGSKDEVSRRRLMTNNDFYLECATSKYYSISCHIAYQKVPMSKSYAPEQWTEVLAQEFTLDGQTFMAEYEKIGGVSDYSMLNIGLRYGFFASNKTVAAPIGLRYYFGLDMNINKALENNFIYELRDNWSLTPGQKALAESGYKTTDLEETKSTNFSICFGGETKLLLTSNVFFKLSGEMNFSTVGFKLIKDDFSSGFNTSINEDLKKYGYVVNRYRNFILIGMGIGVLI